jgi:hypothetical protein
MLTLGLSKVNNIQGLLNFQMAFQMALAWDIMRGIHGIDLALLHFMSLTKPLQTIQLRLFSSIFKIMGLAL